MNYTLIDRQEAQVPSRDRAARRRIEGLDALVAGLVPGKVARLPLAEDEKGITLSDQLFRAAARQGKLVDVWEVAGVLWAEPLGEVGDPAGNYALVDRGEAPERPKDRGKRRRVEAIDVLVARLVPGTVARVELGEDKAHVLSERLYRAAARQGKLIDVWEDGGVLWADLLGQVGPDPDDPAANYTLVDRRQAPARSLDRGKRRRLAGVDDLVASLVPGKVARVEIGEDETSRQVSEQLYRSAARQGKLVDVREDGRVIWVDLLGQVETGTGQPGEPVGEAVAAGAPAATG